MSKKNNKFKFILSAIALIIVLFGLMTLNETKPDSILSVSYSRFIQDIEQKRVKKVWIKNSFSSPKAYVEVEYFPGRYQVSLLTPIHNDQQFVSRIIDNNIEMAVLPEEIQAQFSLTGSIVMLCIIIAFIFLGPILFGNSSGNPLSSIIRGSKKRINTKTNVKFSDIYGIETIKSDVLEVVEFLKAPEKFAQLKAKMPRGVLFFGEPGVGKTMIAKAVASEAGVDFISTSASEFVEIFVGVGASRIRELFDDARSRGNCVIFIDEIDAIGRKRGKRDIGGSSELEQTLNQLLTEMDGFEPNQGILVIGATNREDVLDSALIRSGRFDRKIYIPKPLLEARIGIFRGCLRNFVVDPKGINIKHAVELSVGMVGADIANAINEAAILAVKDNSKYISTKHLNAAMDKIVLGKNSELTMSTDEKKRVSYHEAGHALLSILTRDPEDDSSNCNPIYKATIIPKGRALGMVVSLPERDEILIPKAKMINEICMTMGGKAAEEIIYGPEKISGGPAGDIQQATRSALFMVSRLGFNKEIGNLDCDVLDNSVSNSHFFSEDLMNKIYKDARNIISEQYERALKLLNANIEKLHMVAKLLRDHEEVDGKIIEEIVNATDLNPEYINSSIENNKNDIQYVYKPENENGKILFRDKDEDIYQVSGEEDSQSKDNLDPDQDKKQDNKQDDKHNDKDDDELFE